ncbi:hypothetical protein C8J57DRAFT_1238086 [Mycena rebaudengoi]|nr:hypothetical protein C8J57DRAFT_1238086 [Mycena rebaudengoi]
MSPRMWAADLTNFDDLLDYVRNARLLPFWNCIYNVDFHAPVVYRSDYTALTNDDEFVFYTTLFGKATGPVRPEEAAAPSSVSDSDAPTGDPVIPDSTIGASDSTTLPNMNAGRRYKRKACDSAPPSPAELIKTSSLHTQYGLNFTRNCMIPTSDPEAPPWDREWNLEIFPPPSPTVHPPFIQHPTVQPTANSSDSGGDSPMSFDEDHYGSRDAPLSPMDEDSETVDVSLTSLDFGFRRSRYCPGFRIFLMELILTRQYLHGLIWVNRPFIRRRFPYADVPLVHLFTVHLFTVHPFTVHLFTHQYGPDSLPGRRSEFSTPGCAAFNVSATVPKI